MRRMTLKPFCRKTFVLVCFLVIAAGRLWAGEVSLQTARDAGERFLASTVLGEDKVEMNLDLVYVATDRGVSDYYVFNAAGGGFVVIAGDDRVKPVLAYSTEGKYDPENVAEGFAFVLETFRQEIRYVREHHLAATPDIIAEWDSVLAQGSLFPGRSARSVVGPLCQTLWHQNYPYNSQCPEDPLGPGGFVYGGCVATAMAQVMKFHDWPDRGTGTYSYFPEGYPQQTADFGNTDYHFELMPLALDSTSSEEEVFYIAQLLHHCGVAVDMVYGPGGSGAFSDFITAGLRAYFRYRCDPCITNQGSGNNNYTVEQWTAMLKSGGLDEGIPLYYSATDDDYQMGHAFVCDGYDENDYFHFNWGWSGRDNAWCPVGALNITAYAFNVLNAFIGHILPRDSEYFQRADSVANFHVIERSTMAATLLSWTNPSLDLNGDPLDAIESVVIRRNNQVIATLTDAQPGAFMSYNDFGLAPGRYEYAIFVTNSYGISRNVYRSILVGEKCDVVFHLYDEGGNGWAGASISVTDEQGQRIAVVTMDEGSEQTLTLPLLKQNLNFIWNHGWYHVAPIYDTDFECAFTITDSFGNELYTSGDLNDGVFLSFYNDCEFVPLTCYPVQNLEGEYQWHDSEEYGAVLRWEKPVVTTGLNYFQVKRTTGVYGEELVGEVVYTGADRYEYFDNASLFTSQEAVYSVNCVFIRGCELCESEYLDVTVQITDVEEHVPGEVNLYPNPTSGRVTVEGAGLMHVTVLNVLGQKVLEKEIHGTTELDLSDLGQGLFILRVDTASNATLFKLTLN